MTPPVKSRTIAAPLAVAALLLPGCATDEWDVDEEMQNTMNRIDACTRVESEVKRRVGPEAGHRYMHRCLNEILGLPEER